FGNQYLRNLDFGFRDNNRPFCGFYADDLDDDTAITDTNWHYMVCQYDASTNARAIWVDGVEVASNTTSGDLNATGNVMIGNNPAEAGQNFNGDIDEVRSTIGTFRSDDWITTTY